MQLAFPLQSQTWFSILSVEQALLPQETVVYVPALKQGPATVGSEVLMRVGLAAALVSLCLLLGSSPNPFFCAQQVPDPLEHRQRLWTYSLMSCATGRNMLVHPPTPVIFGKFRGNAVRYFPALCFGKSP